jgi:hypothetical protein
MAELEAYLRQRMNARLRELNPGRIVLQTPVLRGPADAEVVRFEGPLPVFDAEARGAEESQCRYLAEFGDEAAIEAFLRRCVHCPCRAALEERKTKFAGGPRACQDERPVWEQVQRSGDMNQVRWMATTARCGIIRAAAEAYIAKAQEKQEAEKRRAEEARLKAVEEQRARDDAAARARRAEEDRRLAEQRRLEEEARRKREQDSERERLAEERRKLDEERQRIEEERKRLAAIVPPPAPAPTPVAPACGWYAIAFCRPRANEAEVHQWNNQNARAQVIDTSSAAYPNFSPGWFCVVSGPHDKAVAASIEARWKNSGYRTTYIKNACK